MNKKQLIFMWLGIATILLVALITIVGSYHPDYANFTVWVLLVGLVTSGFIYTFRDKKRQEGEKIRSINLRRGFRRITLFLAIIAAVSCTIMACLMVVYEHDTAQGYLRWKQENFLEKYGDIFDRLVFEDTGRVEGAVVNIAKFREKYPQYNDVSNKELLPAVEKLHSEDQAEIRELEKGFWVTLSKQKLVGLCILAGLGGAATGFCGIWLIYHIIRWLVTGFYDTNQ